MTPHWIPNLHPLIVHFPIALLVTAVLFDAASLFFSDENWLEKATLALYTTGTLGLIASFLSGPKNLFIISLKYIFLIDERIPVKRFFLFQIDTHGLQKCT